MLKFFSIWENQIIEATILEERKHTFKLLLPDGTTIVKKRKQVIL